MIHVSSQAITAVKNLRKSKNDETLGLRLAVAGGGCSGFSYKMDLDNVKKPGDLTFEQDGVVFFVDEKSHKLLDGLELDYFDTETKKGFTFKNPNASGTCGCGSSFSV